MKKRFLLTLLMLALVLSVVALTVAAAAPAGIGVEDGKLIGLDSAKTYEYAKVTFPAGTVDEASYADYTDGTALAAGVYSVREKDTTDAATVWVKGANYGTISWEAGNTVETAGAWTVVSPLGNIAPSRNTEYKGYATEIKFASTAANSQEKYNSGVYTYNFKDDEVLPLYDFVRFDFSKVMAAGGYHVQSNTDKAYGLATVYVYGGAQASYSVPFTWGCKNWARTDLSIDFASVYAGSSDGYVYKIAIDFCDETNPNWAADGVRPALESELADVGNGAYSYQVLQFVPNADNRIPVGLRTPEAAPVLGIEGTGTDGVYRITGLDASKRYAVSSNNVDFDDVAANSTYVDVTGEGTHYVYVKGGVKTSDSAVTSVTVAGAMPAIPEDALYYDKATGTIKGFDTLASDKTVEWGKVSVDGKCAWDNTATSTDTGIAATYGNYAFRYAGSGEYVASAPYYVFVYEGGSNKGTISFKAGGQVDGYVQGQWTGFRLPNNGIVMKLSQEGTGKRIASGFNASSAAKDAAYIGYRYALQDNEVFPLSELKSMTFSLGFSNGAIYNTTKYPGYVRLYIAGGDAPYYDVPFTMAGEKTITTVPVYTIWEDEVAADANFIPEGYVVAWDVYYFREDALEGLTVIWTGDDWQYPVFNTNGIDTTTLMTSKFVTLKETIKIDTLSTVPALTNVGGEITGLNPNATYLFALYDKTTGTTGEWAAITGVESVRDLPAGAYAIRGIASATDANYASSDVTVVEIGTLDTQGRDTVKMDKIVLPEDITVADAEYVFDVDASRWINRLALSNIAYDSPDSNIVFKAENYKITVAASKIDLALEAAHYFDMKVTFDGESAYDRMYDKMAAAADEKELVKGIHFESSTAYFFEEATFEVYVGDKYDGYEVEICSFNERVSRLRNEETATVEGGWASFSVFGGDYLIISPAFAKDN